MQGKISQTLAAGQTAMLPGGRSFYLITAPDPVTLVFHGYYKKTIETVPDIEAGIKITPKEEFANVSVYSATAQTIECYLTDGDIEYDRLIGSVSLLGTPNVNVANTPDVNVANTPDVHITNMPIVDLYGTPDVKLTTMDQSLWQRFRHDFGKTFESSQGNAQIGYVDNASIIDPTEYAHAQLYNPDSSGRFLELRKMIVAAPPGTTLLRMGRYNSQLSGVAGNTMNKSSLTSDVVASVNGYCNAAPAVANGILIYPEDAPLYEYNFDPFLIINETRSFVVMNPNIGENLRVMFEWCESATYYF